MKKRVYKVRKQTNSHWQLLLSIVILPIIALLTQFMLQKETAFDTHAADSVAPSGENMPVGDLNGWKQVFIDDFTTNVPVGNFPNAVSDKWDAYPDGWKDTSENGIYTPSKVISINNGILNMYLHSENGVHMVSAPRPKIPETSDRGGQLYGRYAVRFKADPVAGYKTAWLLWPDSETWPRDGEIDFPEGDLDSTINGFMHRQNGTSGSDQDAYSTNTTYISWHTAVTEWTATRLTFILDGKVIGESTSRIPNTPMHWVLQTETALDGTVPIDSASGNVQIDWVAVYIPCPTCTKAPSSISPSYYCEGSQYCVPSLSPSNPPTEPEPTTVDVEKPSIVVPSANPSVIPDNPTNQPIPTRHGNDGTGLIELFLKFLSLIIDFLTKLFAS